MKSFLSTFFWVAMLSGCTSLSGFDASNSFGCKAPDGVLCESMSGIYANAEQNNLPSQRVRHGNAPTEQVQHAPTQVGGILTKPISSGTPIRSAPRVLRVWFSPWEDTDGDLHDQSYVYLAFDSGHWLVEHNRRRIQDAYKPVHAPSKPQAAPPVTNDAVSNVHNGAEQGSVSIGAVQPRPSAQEAAAMMGDIQTPGQINQK